jgi:thiosulfate reductase/polysulfide reductase chain A
LSYNPYKYKEADELFFINGKSAVRTNGAGANNVWLNNLLSEAAAWIHPNTAKKFGIKDGDEIEVYNKYATQRGHAMLTEGIREDTVFAYFGFGHVSKKLRFSGKGIHSNSLYPSFTGKNSGMDLHVVGVKIRKV